MKYTRPFAWIAMLVLTLLAMPAFAGNDNDRNCHRNHNCNSRCTPNNHHNHRCDSHCHRNVQTVTVTNTVVVLRTNTFHVPVYVTNTVTEVVTNIVEASLDDASVNYTLQERHRYGFYVWNGKRWAAAGAIVSASNQVVRISVPGYLVRPTPLIWQLVDVTAGFPRTAVPAEEPVALPNLSFVAMNGRLYRVLR